MVVGEEAEDWHSHLDVVVGSGGSVPGMEQEPEREQITDHERNSVRGRCVT
jgi:hypothetical protein